MRIRRSKPVDNFTIIPNATLRDERLSYCARGVLAELLSRPSGWETNADALSERARRHRGDTVGEGRRALRAAFKELEAAGYLLRRKEKGEKGRIVTVLEVFDVPQVGESGADRRTGHRGTAGGTSADGTSVSGTSASGTSIRSTDVRSAEEEDRFEEDATSTSLPEIPEPPVAPEVPDGGGGGSDLRSLAIHIADSLDYRGKPPGKRLRQTIEDRLTAALAAGWSVNGLAVVLDIEGQDVDYPAAVYAHRLDPAELPPTEPVSAPQPFRGGVRGDVLTAAEVEALELEDVLSTTRRDTADGGMWERAMARARGGTDDRVAGWGAVARELARREHQPYSNPQDDSICDEPWTVPPPRPSWCGEPECEPIGRMREYVDASGLKRDVPCPRCHPDRARAA